MDGSTIGRCHGNAFALARFILLGLAILPCSGISPLSQVERYNKKLETPMHKVQLTQKGYIQFLRWELPVPDLTEFTFCLWIQSNELAHSHSIFSYSKNERERLVRAWISPGGRSVHLEIDGRQVLVSSTDIRENRWYHLCLSWENQAGRSALWINGRLRAEGRSEETRGHAIPSGGDIVLGQEYTDFDKGLEDGVEGSVLGFNLLLASAFVPLAGEYDREASSDPIALPAAASSYATVPLFARIPTKLMQRGIDYGTRTLHAFLPISNQPRGRRYADNADTVWSRTLNRTNGERDVTNTVSAIRRATTDSSWRDAGRMKMFELEKEPLGMQLIKLSYVRCEIGRGSPFVGGRLMLISWSRTPVRVFGGAILKNVKSECGNF